MDSTARWFWILLGIAAVVIAFIEFWKQESAVSRDADRRYIEAFKQERARMRRHHNEDRSSE